MPTTMPTAANAASDVPSAVLFDLGGVLIDWDPRYLFRKLVADDDFIEWFLSDVCSSEWNAQQDAGRPWADAVAEASARHPEHAVLIQAYAARWPEMIGGDIAGTVAILEELAAARVPLYALTNWSAETFPIARARFPWLRHFADIVVSGEVGLKKPDRKIFDIVIERMDHSPDEAVFVDDVLANVVAGQAAGLRGVHFTTPQALKETREIGALLATTM